MADVVARRGAAGTAGSTGATGSGGSGGSGTGGGPGMVSRLVSFYQGVVAEMKKVTWPDFAQVRSATITIIIFVLLVGLLITLLDFALQGILIKAIPSLFAGR